MAQDRDLFLNQLVSSEDDDSDRVNEAPEVTFSSSIKASLHKSPIWFCHVACLSSFAPHSDVKL